jgi:hypothetical protein
MFKLYRPIEQGEFFVVFGDCAQGGADKNYVQFMSRTRADIPLVLAMNGVAAEMTPHLRQALEYIYIKTKIPPTVALERNMGGASAMQDLMNSNYENHYTCYFMRDFSTGQSTDKLGWDTTGNASTTNPGTRPKMLGEWLTAFNSKIITIYDHETIEQHQTFIVNKNGKPEAAPNTHDDAVMSCAGAWQLYQTENPPVTRHHQPPRQRLKFHV